MVDSSGSPFVCGLRRPWLVLPEGLASLLGPDELRQVLLHELAHVKRGDLIWDWFPAIARMLFFFHPVAHWAAGRILLERELACDQAALRLSNRDEAGYARMLVRVASLASFPLCAGTGNDGELQAEQAPFRTGSSLIGLQTVLRPGSPTHESEFVRPLDDGTLADDRGEVEHVLGQSPEHASASLSEFGRYSPAGVDTACSRWR